MFIVSQDKKKVYNTVDDYTFYLGLKDKTINYGLDVFGKYKTEEEAKAAFEDLIAQLDEIEGGNNETSTGFWASVDKFGALAMIPFQKADTITRVATTLAAYKIAKTKGKSERDAIAYAEEVNRKSVFDYSVADSPDLFRRTGALGQILLLFKKFGIKEAEVMADFMPWSEKATKEQKAFFLMMPLLMYGLMGIPTLDFWDWLFGKNMLKVGQLKDALQKGVINNTDPGFGKMAMYGLPAMFGVNISNRAGLPALIPTQISDFLGPFISKSWNLIDHARQSNYDNGIPSRWADMLRDISPGLYNITTALSGESVGYRDRVNTRYADTADKFWRAVGFRSVDESLSSDKNRIVYNDKNALQADKRKAIDDYIANPSSENFRRLKELGIKPDTVKKERERKRLDRTGRTEAGLSKNEMRQQKDFLSWGN